MEIRTKI